MGDGDGDADGNGDGDGDGDSGRKDKFYSGKARDSRSSRVMKLQIEPSSNKKKKQTTTATTTTTTTTLGKFSAKIGRNLTSKWLHSIGVPIKPQPSICHTYFRKLAGYHRLQFCLLPIIKKIWSSCKLDS
uniref:Uncharacterized protein n=1 Tax=Vespula pensylvanica TaxID=30213 RepID=A0A834JPA1_VESPE|nr:hypothetical protein H0235_017150 [Vespula pensylvanica]